MWIRFALLPLVALTARGQERAPGNETILKDQLKADLYFLAGDAMRGRLTGSHEYELAAGYVESRFQRLGLKPAAGDSMFHRFDLILSRLDEPNRLQFEQRQGKLLEDFYPLIFSANARVSAPVAFAGYGEMLQRPSRFLAEVVRFRRTISRPPTQSRGNERCRETRDAFWLEPRTNRNRRDARRPARSTEYRLTSADCGGRMPIVARASLRQRRGSHSATGPQR